MEDLMIRRWVGLPVWRRVLAVAFSLFVVAWFANYVLRHDWKMVGLGLAVVALIVLVALTRTTKVIVVILLLAAASQTVAANSLVVGVASESRVELSAVPHASGAWGTDYLTAAHGLRVGGNQITLDGRLFETGRLVALCSGIVHGIDAMLLRVSAHRNRPVVTWGDASDLKPGDELRVVPYDLPPITLRLVHHAFGQWAGRDTEEWPAEVNHALVAETQDPRAANGLSGYSGSPWMRNGRAYGLHKGSAKAKDDKIVALAEPVTRIKECFERMGYSP